MVQLGMRDDITDVMVVSEAGGAQEAFLQGVLVDVLLEVLSVVSEVAADAAAGVTLTGGHRSEVVLLPGVEAEVKAEVEVAGGFVAAPPATVGDVIIAYA